MYDVIIIGAGPAGMSASIYLKNANKNVLILEKDTPGGKILKAKKINNYLGLNNVEPSEIAYEMYNQVLENNIEIRKEKVIEIDKIDNKTIVKTNKNTYETKYILLSCGRIEKTLNLDMEEELLGKGVSYCAECDGNLYKDKIVTVIGNNNDSIEDARYLSGIARKVNYINYSKDKIDFKEENIFTVENSKVTKLCKENEVLTKILLDNGQEINTDALFILTGYTPNSNFIEKLKISTKDGYIIVDKNMKTNIDNIYASGDIIKKDLYQIITAAAEGAVAAVSIAKLLN